MAKRVLFVIGPALGHVVRSMVIAKALMSQGSYVIFFAGVRRGHGKKVLSGVFPFCELPDKDRDCIKFADALETLLHKLSPDLVCLDLTPIPWLLQVRFPNIPQVYLTNFFLTQLCSYTTYQEMSFKNSEQRVNKIRNSRGLESILNVKQMYDKDAVIFCDPPSLITSQKSLPSNYHIAGPCAWKPSLELPDELKSLKEFLFISFGSTGIKPMPYQLVEKIAKVLNTQDIIWLGNKHLHKKIRSGPFRHRYYSWLPTSRVLTHSKFVITQGGAGSTYQALEHGKPVGIWPSQQNQKILGSIVQDFGCGALLDEATEVNQLIGNNFCSMQSRSKELAQSLSKTNGPIVATNMIVRMLH